MRHYSCSLFLLFVLGFTNLISGQSVNFEDGFEDGDFTDNPAWSGDTGKFMVVDNTPNYQLQLQGDSENGGVSYLSTSSTNTLGSWEFFIDLDFSPSGSNHAHIFLMSDIADLEGTVNGYALQAGESGGDDVFRIVRFDNGTKAATILSGSTDISDGGEFRVKVTRQIGGNWTLEVAEGYAGRLTQEGSPQTDNTYSSTSFFGARATYTSSRYNLFNFDFKIDLPPFITTEAVPADSNIIDVAFNRPLDQSTASPEDFVVNKQIGSPSSVIFPADDTTRLTFSQAFPSDQYTLSVDGVSDLSGNPIQSGSQNTFTIFGTYRNGDVKINEFVYDPPGGQSEYVELINTSNKVLDLSGWRIGDDSGTDPIESHPVVLQADSFLVISSDTSALSSVYGERKYFEFDELATLNNSGGDAIQLVTDNGTMADSLFYTTGWGGTDVALERRSITAKSIYKENWGNSPNANGGSPGLSNQLPPDKTPPLLSGFYISSDQTLKLGFDERIDPETASEITNYSLTNSTVNSVNVTDPDSVEISLSTGLQNAQSYTLSISGIEDIFANGISDADTTFTFYEISRADSGDVAVNEFMFAPPTGSTEYVEIYNYSAKSLDLQGWTLSDNRGDSSQITGNQFIVPPDSFVVIAPDNTLLSTYPDIALVTMNDFPALNNAGDDIVIRNSAGTLLDSLAYSSDWGGDEVALERRSSSISGSYQNNWANAPNGFGTPGFVNQIKPDTSAPELVSVTILNSTKILLKFSDYLEKSSAGNNANYFLLNGPAVSDAGFGKPDSVLLTLGSDLQNATDYTLTVNNIADIFGNADSTASDTSFTFYKVSPVDSGDVFINEFSFEPPSGSTEYVEIYNHTSKSFDLQGWTLSDNRGTSSKIIDHQFIVPPDSFVVIAPDNTLLTNYTDISLIAMTNFPALNNSSDAIEIRDKNDTLLDSLRYSSAWGGHQIALERRSTEIAGFYQNNWGDAPNGFGTPGSENQIKPDSTSPKLISLAIPASKQISLQFSEQLDQSSAENEVNYSLRNGPAITDAVFSNPDSVFLTLDSDLQNATDYTLTVNNIADIFGNADSTAPDTSFTFYKVSPVDSGDVFINEFSFEPPSGSTEYVEIYNPTSKSFDLQGWTLSDNRNAPSKITKNRYIIPPDSFVVIAPDNTLLTNHPDIPLTAMTNFPALNNSSDAIAFRNKDGLLIDSLRYTSAWGGKQVALERRTTEFPSTIRQNWVNAPSGTGTPGTTNDIEEDQTPPEFTDLLASDALTVQLVFSETVTAASAIQAGNYQINPTREIQLILADEDSVTLSLKKPLTSGKTYKVTVSNISDVFGNTLADSTKTFEFIKIGQSQPLDIVINEILYDPGDNQSEFIELYNPGEKNFALNEWYIGDDRSKTSIDQNIQLLSGEYLVVTANSNFAAQLENAITVSGLPALNGDSDAIYIQNKKETTIDSLYYSLKWGGDQDGHSLERKDPLAASNDAFNWQTSTAKKGHSAGSENAGFQPDTNPPDVKFSKVLSDDNIEVQFSEFIRMTDQTRFLANRQELRVLSFDPDEANYVVLEPPSLAKRKKVNTKISVKNLVDFRGNSTANAKISIARPVQSSALVINEIMYNPLDEPDDNRPDQSEYVELRNMENHAISLEGLVLHDAPDEDGNLRELQPISTIAKWVPANGHVLVYASEVASFGQSQIATFFDLEPMQMQSVMRVDRSSLSLASSGDAIFIADSTGVTIDSVFYDESWQNPNLIDPTGVSLERISPHGPSNDDSNWGSSVDSKGGTPNSKNSIYQENPESQQEAGISFTPNPFSPDDDGHEDILFINYKLEQQDYLIRVRIYDRYGRLVRELADGEQAGFEGQLIWDGRKDDGSRNRIGIYIVVFEAFDSVSGQNRSFKETVVLARKLN